MAENFTDFLRLILACNYAGAVEQLAAQNWSREELQSFMDDLMNAIIPEQKMVLNALRDRLGIVPMEDPWAYEQALNAKVDLSCVRFSDEYYDTLGLENPDGE